MDDEPAQVPYSTQAALPHPRRRWIRLALAVMASTTQVPYPRLLVRVRLLSLDEPRMIIAGIDPSLRRTGLAALDGGRPIATHSLGYDGTDSDSYLVSSRRVRALARDVAKWLRQFDFDYAVIEGHPFGSLYGKAHDRSGLWHGIFGDLDVRRIPCAVVNPTTRAAWATGKGRADKSVVLAEVRSWWPTVHVANHDIADAAILALMAEMHHGGEMPFTVKARHHHGITVPVWPEVVA